MKIDSIDKLRSVYGATKERAVLKQLTELDQHMQRFIQLSPFVVLSTSNLEHDQDASPRGGVPGFVKILSPTRIIFPDLTGNRRLDSFTNIIVNNKVGLLFLIPGFDETLRVNGTACLSNDAELLSVFSADVKLPTVVLEIEIQAVYLHCAKALMRSSLWDVTKQIPRSSLPSMGEMLKDQIPGIERAESQEEMLKRYQQEL